MACLIVMANYGDLCASQLRALLRKLRASSSPATEPPGMTTEHRLAYAETLDAKDIVDDVVERPHLFVASKIAVCRYARSLEQQLASGVLAGGQWRPIETAPKTGDDLVAKCFLGYCPERHPNDRVKICWWEPKVKGGIWVREGADIDLPVHPTYWMPLPAPPAAEGEV